MSPAPLAVARAPGLLSRPHGQLVRCCIFVIAFKQTATYLCLCGSAMGLFRLHTVLQGLHAMHMDA